MLRVRPFASLDTNDGGGVRVDDAPMDVEPSDGAAASNDMQVEPPA